MVRGTRRGRAPRDAHQNLGFPKLWRRIFAKSKKCKIFERFQTHLCKRVAKRLQRAPMVRGTRGGPAPCGAHRKFGFPKLWRRILAQSKKYNRPMARSFLFYSRNVEYKSRKKNLDLAPEPSRDARAPTSWCRRGWGRVGAALLGLTKEGGGPAIGAWHLTGRSML